MLNWAIIGTGDVVQRLVDNSLFIKNKSIVTSVLSDNLDEAKLYGNKHKIKFIYSKTKKNLEKILNDKSINSVYIATPPNSHFFYINFFCKKKINIVCEKPLVIKKTEIKKLQNLKKKYKFNLFTCFYRRYLERFLYVKKVLEKKYIGKIIYFDIKFFHSHKNHPTHNIVKGKRLPWRFVKKISGGGNIVDMGVHALDLIEFMMGEIENINVLKSNNMKLYKVEDMCITNFKLKNKILGQSSWCSVSDEKVDRFSIFGNKGSIHFSMNLGENEVIQISKNGKKILKKIKMRQPLHKNMFKIFINQLIKNNKEDIYEIKENGIKNSNLVSKIIEKSLV
ncbi:Gfo/Idh/MocA family oxidoreductase [Candidatus Pelagibacter sp.]|nr:Gfo/Idh/MocA family oxidoreductase [Candidatus Pelagibacter sp.]